MTLTMEERLDRETKGWKPEPGAKLVGTIIDRVDGIEGGYEPYSIIAVETTAGELVDVHCFHTTLRSEVARRNPQPGDLVGIKYYSRVTEGGRTGQGFEKYQVYVEKVKHEPPPAPALPAFESGQPRSKLEQLAADAGVAPVPSESDRPEDDETV